MQLDAQTKFRYILIQKLVAEFVEKFRDREFDGSADVIITCRAFSFLALPSLERKDIQLTQPEALISGR